MTNNDSEEIVRAIDDLTSVMVAMLGNFSSKSEAVRKLNDLSIPPSRIARILAMNPKDVTSVISKTKKPTTSKGS